MVLYYQLVSATASQWFISSQLLYFSIPMTLFILIEFCRAPQKRRFQPLINIFFCTGVAISAGFTLILSAIVVSHQSQTEQQNRQTKYSVPFKWIVVFPLIVSFCCVLILPVVVSSPETFSIILAGVHLGCLLPAAVCQLLFPSYVMNEAQDFSTTSAVETNKNSNNNTNGKEQEKVNNSVEKDWRQRTASSLWIPICFSCFACCIGCMHIVNFLQVVASNSPDRIFASIFEAFCENDCQCSISLDVMQTTFVMLLFLWFVVPTKTMLSTTEKTSLTIATFLLSLGFSFSLGIAIIETKSLYARMTTEYDELFETKRKQKLEEEKREKKTEIGGFDDDDDEEEESPIITTTTATAKKKSSSRPIQVTPTINLSPTNLIKRSNTEDSFHIASSKKSNNNKNKKKSTNQLPFSPVSDDSPCDNEASFSLIPGEKLKAIHLQQLEQEETKKEEEEIRKEAAAKNKKNNKEEKVTTSKSSRVVADDNDDDDDNDYEYDDENDSCDATPRSQEEGSNKADLGDEEDEEEYEEDSVSSDSTGVSDEEN